MTKIKPWYKSPSLWAAVAAAITAVINSLVQSGQLSAESIVVIAALALATILKRGFVEATAIKAEAVKEAAKLADPTE